MTTLNIVLSILSMVFYTAGFLLQRKRLKQERRRAELDHMQKEVDFMEPIFRKLNSEALMHWHDGDFAAYEKTRKRILALQKRWKREVTDKLPHTKPKSFF